MTARHRRPLAPLLGRVHVDLDDALRRQGVICAHGLTACEGCRLYRQPLYRRGVALAAPVLPATRLLPTIRGGQ